MSVAMGSHPPSWSGSIDFLDQQAGHFARPFNEGHEGLLVVHVSGHRERVHGLGFLDDACHSVPRGHVAQLSKYQLSCLWKNSLSMAAAPVEQTAVMEKTRYPYDLTHALAVLHVPDIGEVRPEVIRIGLTLVRALAFLSGRV